MWESGMLETDPPAKREKRKPKYRSMDPVKEDMHVVCVIDDAEDSTMKTGDPLWSSLTG